MHKELFSIFTTKSGHNYCYDINRQYLMFLHPILKYILDNHFTQGRIDVLNCVNDINLSVYEPSTIQYYIRKLTFLAKNNMFQFQDTEKITYNEIGAEQVMDNFASSNHICLEVTQRCNLDCYYCIYGNHYNFSDSERNSNMPFETAKAIIDYKVNLWNSNNNNSGKIIKLIGFYGGEPLLNTSLIKKIVSYTKEIESTSNFRFRYHMTTNGLLLDHHINYLIENNFSIAISLDGDRKHNQYRVLCNKEESFNMVMNNICFIKNNQRKYFDENITFQTVLHNKSDTEEIIDFFRVNFNKQPDMNMLNPKGDNELQKLFYLKTQKKISNQKFRLKYDVSNFFSYNKYLCHHDLLITRSNCAVNCMQTGTCTPFSKLIYITVNGSILMCERIPHKYLMGQIISNNIDLNFDKAANIYNTHLARALKQCKLCYNVHNCRVCIMDEIHYGKCFKFMEKEKFNEYILNYVQHYEQY